MMRLPIAARLYVIAMIAAGAAVLAALVPSLHFPHPSLFAGLLALSVISSALKVDLPIGVGSSCISLSYAVDFTALLLLGPAPTVLIAVASAWAQCSFRMKQRNPAYKTLFSMSCLAVTVFAASIVYSGLGGIYGQLSSLQALVGAAMTYFLVNSSAVAAAFALATRGRVFQVWHDNFLWSITSYVVGAVAAGIAVEVWQRLGHWETSLAVLPLCLTYRTYRIYLDRIAAEQRRVAEWTQLHRESTEVLARAIQAKDAAGSRHIERVQYYASSLARRAELSEMDTQAVETAALLHDIGKLAVPEHILSKPGPLSAHERKKMQIHAQVGAEIVDAVAFPCPVAPLIRSHHERWDGTGYPAGLRGEDIPIGARILAVVDTFDAITSERPYRRSVSPEAALEILEREAGKALDPVLVKQFAEILPTLKPPSEDDAVRRTGEAEHDGSGGERAVRHSSANAFAEIAQANRESYTLYEIAQAMGRSISVTETMALISSRLSTLVPFSSCALFVRGDGETLRCRFASGLDAHLLENTTLKDGLGLSGWVTRHGRPLVNGVAVVELHAAGHGAVDTALESALVCPLAVGDKVIGSIAVYHVEAGCYTEDHRRVLEEVSRQAAAVVQNGLVFEQACDHAMRDGLTGLANTRALQSHVTRELDRARRSGSQFSVVLLDLDEFKRINDEHGHLSGDRALQDVARALRETTRPYDVCVRYGGDEFVVLLASSGRADADQQRRRLQDAVSAIRFEAADGTLVPVNVSAGAAVYPDDGETYERLLARADRRMYRDKAQRKSPRAAGVIQIAPHLEDARERRFATGG
ncbi:MAG TPA: diguanylate cyclase [Vicinamibacterales bacterium]|nr:diguanylate cyclase [Vicinamibacterales bacterium]